MALNVNSVSFMRNIAQYSDEEILLYLEHNSTASVLRRTLNHAAITGNVYLIRIFTEDPKFLKIKKDMIPTLVNVNVNITTKPLQSNDYQTINNLLIEYFDYNYETFIDIKLEAACKIGNLEAVKNLLAVIRERNYEKDYHTIARLSVLSKNLELVKYLNETERIDYSDHIFMAEGDILDYLYENYKDKVDLYHFFNMCYTHQNIKYLQIICERLDVNVNDFVDQRFEENINFNEVDSDSYPLSFRFIEEFLHEYPDHNMKIVNLPLDKDIQALDIVIANIFETIKTSPLS